VDTVSAPIEVRGLRGSRHELHTVSAGIEVLDSDGAFDLHAVSGTIKHEDARGHVRAETVSGSITLGGAPENAEIETVSGQVRVSGVRGKISAESVSGSLRVVGQDVEDAEFSTVSGGIKFSGSLRSGGDLYAKAISGGIEIRLDDVAGRYDLQTFSGSIRNAFGPKLDSNRRGPGRELRFSEGGDSRRIVAETFSGSISIDKN